MAGPHHDQEKAPYLAGVLAWLVPGGGHWYLGLRVRAVIIFTTVGAMFWAGVAIGGLRSTIDPQENRHWFMGQVCTGGPNVGVALLINRSIPWHGDANKSWGRSRDISMVYTGVAGLLNLLCIFDAIVRSLSSGQADPDKQPHPNRPQRR